MLWIPLLFEYVSCEYSSLAPLVKCPIIFSLLHLLGKYFSWCEVQLTIKPKGFSKMLLVNVVRISSKYFHLTKHGDDDEYAYYKQCFLFLKMYHYIYYSFSNFSNLYSNGDAYAYSSFSIQSVPICTHFIIIHQFSIHVFLQPDHFICQLSFPYIHLLTCLSCLITWWFICLFLSAAI